MIPTDQHVWYYRPQLKVNQYERHPTQSTCKKTMSNYGMHYPNYISTYLYHHIYINYGKLCMKITSSIHLLNLPFHFLPPKNYGDHLLTGDDITTPTILGHQTGLVIVSCYLSGNAITHEFQIH